MADLKDNLDGHNAVYDAAKLMAEISEDLSALGEAAFTLGNDELARRLTRLAATADQARAMASGGMAMFINNLAATAEQSTANMVQAAIAASTPRN